MLVAMVINLRNIEVKSGQRGCSGCACGVPIKIDKESLYEA